MSRSFLAAIRSAVVSAPEPIAQQDDVAGANAPEPTAPRGHEQENVMNDDPTKPATASGISQADHDAAVAAARAEGHAAGEAAGARAANDRISAIVSAEGIKGDGHRVATAIALAVKSPGMSAADVTAFVTENIVAGKPQGSSASLSNRQTVDPFAVADQGRSDKAQDGWAKATAQANARFGKDAA